MDSPADAKRKISLPAARAAKRPRAGVDAAAQQALRQVHLLRVCARLRKYLLPECDDETWHFVDWLLDEGHPYLEFVLDELYSELRIAPLRHDEDEQDYDRDRLIGWALKNLCLMENKSKLRGIEEFDEPADSDSEDEEELEDVVRNSTRIRTDEDEIERAEQLRSIERTRRETKELKSRLFSAALALRDAIVGYCQRDVCKFLTLDTHQHTHVPFPGRWRHFLGDGPYSENCNCAICVAIARTEVWTVLSPQFKTDAGRSDAFQHAVRAYRDYDRVRRSPIRLCTRSAQGVSVLHVWVDLGVMCTRWTGRDSFMLLCMLQHADSWFKCDDEHFSRLPKEEQNRSGLLSKYIEFLVDDDDNDNPAAPTLLPSYLRGALAPACFDDCDTTIPSLLY
jgi:hypothetical protein